MVVYFDVEEHRNVPKGPQDEGVPEHNVDLGAGNSQLRDVMTGSQCDITSSLDLSIDQSTTPAPEPGPSNVLRLRPVFPDSEVEKNDEGNDEPDGNGGNCVRFRADIESELGDNELCRICLEDPRLSRGEEARQLDVEQELDKLGSRVMTRAERDNNKAMVMKNRKSTHSKSLQKGSRNSLRAAWRLRANTRARVEIKRRIYDCCINSCIRFTREFELHTACPLCVEPRHDRRRKARNRFRYIPIIPRLQSMFRDSHNAQMLLYRLQREVDPDRSEDVWGSMILQELLNTNVAIEGQAQEYH